MIGHEGQLDALLAPHHRRTWRRPADRPAVARHDCPRKSKHWSTKAAVTKKRLPHNTHHTKPEVQNRTKRRSNNYHPCLTVCSKHCRCLLLFFNVRRPTKKLQQLFNRTSVTDTNRVLDTRPTTLFNTGDIFDGCIHINFNLLFLFLTLRLMGRWNNAVSMFFLIEFNFSVWISSYSISTLFSSSRCHTCQAGSV